MPENFADRLTAAIIEKQSQVCVGLDPRLGSMPDAVLRDRGHDSGKSCGNREAAAAIESFCAGIIEAVAQHAVAVKPQLACFELYGPPGIRAFEHTCKRAAGAGLLVIADAKRGDIGISAESYSAAFIGRPPGLEGELGGFGADAVTVNPLFGSDGVEPFINDCSRHGKGLFILVKTSNPGAVELQDLELSSGGTLSERIAVLVSSWGADLVGSSGYSSIGAVVGATDSRAISRYRQMMPRAFLLLPGYGAQGATARDVSGAFDSEGLGALVTASRSIIYAGKDEAYAQAAAAAAADMREELWQVSHG